MEIYDNIQLDLKFTRGPLLTLNKKIKSICDNKLELAIYDNVKTNEELQSASLYDDDSDPDFVICLNYKKDDTKNCISSISCKINKENFSVEFSSKTEKIYEGKKYNVILRSVLIILCPYIKIKIDDTYHNISEIISRAINPISIYLLARYFHAKNDLLEAYMEENSLEYDKLTFENAKDFYDNVDPMEFKDKEEAEIYMKNNKDFGNPILFVIDINDPVNIEQAKKIFNTAVLVCPETTGGRSKRDRSKRTKKRGKKNSKRRYKKGKSRRRK